MGLAVENLNAELVPRVEAHSTPPAATKRIFIINEQDMKPKILYLDIETSPIKAFTWGPKWETNLIEVIEQSRILSFSAKWMGGQHVTRGLPEYKGYKKGVIDDKLICKDLWDLLDEADVVVAHNGKAFDVKTVSARLLANGLGPTAPYRVVDTKTEVKKAFRLPSNSLDDICDYFGLGRKMEHEGFPLWKRCEAGDRAAWDKMLRYNKHDVVLLEKLYMLIRPWISNHPNMATLVGKDGLCPTCLSKKLQKRGRGISGKGTHQRYQCMNTECGRWSRGPSEKSVSIG